MVSSVRIAMLGLAAVLAVGALGSLAAGPLGWRMGWWHYGIAFQTLMPWAGYIGIAACATAAVALALSLVGGGGRTPAFTSPAVTRPAFTSLAFSCLVAGAIAIYFPWQAGGLRGAYPRINDITTDMANPPAFVAALSLRKADGGNEAKYSPETAAEQKKSHPDIGPLTTTVGPAEAFSRAADAAAAMPGWRLVSRDAVAGRIEASQASRWFGFTDDVVIRVMPNGSGSRIDVRSVSRHGRGDFGVNATRVRAYLAALRARLSG